MDRHFLGGRKHIRNQVFKKLFSVLLALIMVAGLLPASVLAEGEGNADSTPAPTEAVQPTESAEPTAPTETETPEVTEVPEPTPENPAATVEPTQGEPTAEPTDEGIMPANVMPVQARVAARDTSGDDYYRIVHLDCGREYFSKDWIIALINEMAAADYNQLQLAFGNGGFRFYLDDMSVDTYSSEAVKSALEYGNKQYNTYGDNGKKDSEWIEYNPTTNALTEPEMDAIIAYAKTKSIEIVPMLNTPGHMNALLHAMSKLEIGEYNDLIVSSGCMNLRIDKAVDFTGKLVEKYIKYFKEKDVVFFHLAMDEYHDASGNTSFTSEFFTYANRLIDNVIYAGMTPRVFNDALTSSNNRNSFTAGTQVCCWNSANVSGYSLINTSHDFYYVSTNEAWNLNHSIFNGEGYTFVGDYAEDTWITHAKKFNNNTFLYKKVSSNINPVGSMFCIWCNTPGKNDETQIAQQIRMILRVIGARMKNENTYKASNELVEGGFKADGTINVPTNNKTVGNGSGNTTADNDTVRVTGPNLAALKCETTTVTIQGAAEGKIAAYNVTPSTADNNKYIGEAEVRIKIPEGWDKTKVKAFIVEDGTAKDIDGTATEDGWYVFTAPHFSVMGIYEKAATTEVSRTITIVEGKEEVLTVDGKVAENKIGDPADTAVAIKTGVKDDTKPSEGTQFTLGNKITTGEGVISDGKGNYLKVSEAGDTSNTTNIAEATVFNVTSSVYLTTYYAIQVKGKNQYLTINNNKLVIQNSSSSWRYSDGYYQRISREYYYLRLDNTTWTVSTGTSGVKGYLYKRVESQNFDYITKITFKGLKEGTTTVTIDGVVYTIEVVPMSLENAEKLYIDFWVTNHRIYPTELNVVTTTSNSKSDARTYYEFSAADFYEAGEEGRVLTDVIPQTGNYESTTGTEALYWKTRYLPNAHRQTEAGWTNKSGYGTDTVTGANGGVDIERIRFYGGKWEYRAVDATDWNKLSGTTADENGNQIVAYYMLKTTVTDEVTTYITDWPDNQTDKFYGVAVDYCVKYESDGVRNPDKFGRAQNSNTQWLNCDGTNNGSAHNNGYSVLASNVTTDWKGLRTNTSGNDWYRVINNIRAVETAEYEIYMVTVTPSESFSLQNQQCPENITYNEQYEKVIWAESQDTIAASGLAQHSEAKIGGEPNIDKLVIQQCSGMLVTYYVRAKASEDSLTVNYYVDGSQTPFHTYNIAVPKNTTFSKEFALTEQGGLINNTVINIKGKTETVQWDLKLMPQIGAQYRYTQYKLVRVAKVTEEVPKTVNLYYTFNATKTFVVDFGLPLRIEPKDLNENLGAVDVNITKTEVGKVSSFAEVIPGENGVITYKLTEMISDKDTFGVKYTGTLVMSDNTLQSGTVEYTVTIIPATNVYYEDSFAKFYGSDGKQQTVFNQTSAGDVAGTWYAAKDTSAENNANTTQALEALGTKENVYGYDPAYQNSTMFSMGSARKVTVTSDMATNWNNNTSAWPTAQFTFKGTGFDIISLTDNTSGAIFVDVYAGKEAKGTMVKSYIVDNYYGYKKVGDNWVVDKESTNALYQIPVMQVRNLTYGEYTAVVTVFYDKAFDHTKAGTSYSFWLDAVRVYDPMGKDNAIYNTGNEKEGYPQYIKLRDAVANANASLAGSKALFIDGAANATIEQYKNLGPNNEVYLAKGQAITFKLAGNDLSKIATVQIGAKSPNSNGTKNANMVIGSITQNLNTATEMYYDITTAAVKNGNAELVTITNTGEAILSLTNLKITYTEGNQTVSLGEVSAEQQTQAVQMVRALFAPAPVEPEPEPEPEKTFEPERFEASWSRNVMQGRKATLTVKTSEDVEAITVDGQTIRSYRTRTERVGFGRRAKRITYREFTYSMVAQESADFSVTAINAEGTESEAITARLTVKNRPNSMRDMWDWFKGWF